MISFLYKLSFILRKDSTNMKGIIGSWEKKQSFEFTSMRYTLKLYNKKPIIIGQNEGNLGNHYMPSTMFGNTVYKKLFL